jgi:hypothetical protein
MAIFMRVWFQCPLGNNGSRCSGAAAFIAAISANSGNDLAGHGGSPADFEDENVKDRAPGSGKPQVDRGGGNKKIGGPDTR